MKQVVLTTLFFLTFLVGQSQTKNFIDQPYIEVNGNADTAITPDEIYIKIVISEGDTKNKISVEDLEIKMVDALKSLGINTEKDLTTSDAASNFKYYFLRGKDILKTKEYVLKVSDAVTVTKVISQLEDLGISNTSIDRVNYSDLESIKNIMRTKAVENAKARALALTKPLNQTVGSAIHITDTDISNVLQGRAEGVVVTGYGIRGRQSVELPKIEFEKIKITTTVNVAFILK
jgi:uncharacterized protein YggE